MSDDKSKVEYDPSFSKEDVEYLRSEGIPPAKANPLKNFNAGDIFLLVHEDIEPEVAHSYPSHYDGDDISSLVQSNILPEVAISYPSRFSGGELVWFIDYSRILGQKEDDRRITPDEVAQFDERMDAYDIVTLIHNNIPPERTRGHDKRFKSHEVMNMSLFHIPPKVSGSYDQRFNGGDTVLLAQSEISPVKAKRFDPRFNGPDICGFVEEGLFAGEVNKYSDRFNGKDVLGLIKMGVSVSEANEYDPEFNHLDLEVMIKAKVPPTTANEYAKQGFDGFGISFLHPVCSPKEASMYHKKLSGWEIAFLHEIGATPDKISTDKQKKILTMLEKTRSHIINQSFVGMGARGIVLFDKDERTAFKYSPHLEHEIPTLQRVHKHVEAEHVIKIGSAPNQNISHDLGQLEMEYIQGETIEEKLYSEEIITERELLQYSRGTLAGLSELLQADVTHRDIHPGNILIEEGTERVVIIDLGIATSEMGSYPIDPKDCRRYGGFDDLFSYGLLVYKMAIGSHLLRDYALSLPKEQREKIENKLNFKSNLSTRANSDWISEHKHLILNRYGELKEEYKSFVKGRLTEEGKEEFCGIITGALNVIGYINHNLSEEDKLTIKEMKQGKKVDYEVVKPIKERLFEELREELSDIR